MLHSRYRRRRLSLAIATLFVSVPGMAQETTLPNVVVSATLSEHETRTAPASVSVVTREEIVAKNPSDLLDIVRDTPGITLMGKGTAGRKTIAMRGMESKHTLMLIDGRRISPTDDVIGHSDYQYGWLPVEAMERVEVMRGASSALYGSEALGGVVNLITRKPKLRWEGSVAVSGGTQLAGEEGNQNRIAAFAGGPLGKDWSLRVVGESVNSQPIARAEDKRYSELEGRRATTGGVLVSYKLAPGHELDAEWMEGKEKRDYDTVSSNRSYRSTNDIERRRGSLAWRAKGSSGWRSEVRAYQSEVDIENSATNGVTPTKPQKVRDSVIDGLFVSHWGKHLLSLGAEYRNEEIWNVYLTGGKAEAKHRAVYAQGEFSLGGNVMLTTGLRSDHHELFGTENSPRAYLVWEASPELIIKGGYGHAFKAPTLKQISPTFSTPMSIHTIKGNASIRPEKADTLELSADWKRGSFGVRGAIFENRVKDLITTKQIARVGSRITYQYTNVEEARIQGLELGMNWDIAHGLNWSSNAVFLHTENMKTGQKLDDRPSNKLNSHLDWQVGNGWGARLAFEHTGRQQSSGVSLPSYQMWNASVSKRIDKKLTVRAGINNLTDVRLAEENANFSYAERGRQLFINLRADF